MMVSWNFHIELISVIGTMFLGTNTSGRRLKMMFLSSANYEMMCFWFFWIKITAVNSISYFFWTNCDLKFKKILFYDIWKNLVKGHPCLSPHRYQIIFFDGRFKIFPKSVSEKKHSVSVFNKEIVTCVMC